MRFIALALILALVLGASAALAQQNQTNQSNQTNQTNATASPSPAPSPSPSATPAPQTARLKIYTVPVEGDIFIDRAPVGNGLFVSDNYTVGSYLLSFGEVKGYFKPSSKAISVEAGKQNSFPGEYVPRAATYPKLTVVREVKPTDVGTGDTVNVILRFSNDGTGTAVNASVQDVLPACVSNPVGDTRWTGRLPVGEKQRITYTATAAKPGLCIFESPKVTYSSEDGTDFRASAEDVSVSIAAKALPQPKLVVNKRAAEEKAVGENVVVTLELQNVGNAPALKVLLSEPLPACAALASAAPQFQGDIPAGDSRTVTYEIGLKKPGLCVFDVSRVTYEDAAGAAFNATSKQLNVLVKEKAFAETLEGYTKPITVIAGAVGAIIFIYTLARKTKTHATEKIKKKKE